MRKQQDQIRDQIVRPGLQGPRSPPVLGLQEDAGQAVRRRFDHERLLPRPRTAWPRRRRLVPPPRPTPPSPITPRRPTARRRNPIRPRRRSPRPARAGRASANAAASASSRSEAGPDRESRQEGDGSASAGDTPCLALSACANTGPRIEPDLPRSGHSPYKDGRGH